MSQLNYRGYPIHPTDDLHHWTDTDKEYKENRKKYGDIAIREGTRLSIL